MPVISSYIVYMYAILPLRFPVVVKLATTPAPALAVGEIKPLRSLRSLRETYNIITTQMYFFPHAEHAKIAKNLLYNAIA